MNRIERMFRRPARLQLHSWRTSFLSTTHVGPVGHFRVLSVPAGHMWQVALVPVVARRVYGDQSYTGAGNNNYAERRL